MGNSDGALDPLKHEQLPVRTARRDGQPAGGGLGHRNGTNGGGGPPEGVPQRQGSGHQGQRPRPSLGIACGIRVSRGAPVYHMTECIDSTVPQTMTCDTPFHIQCECN